MRVGDSLIGVEPDAPDLTGGVPRDEPRRQCWPTSVLAVREQALLGVEDVLAGVGDLIDWLESVALAVDVVGGYGAVVVRGEPERFGFGVCDDLIEHADSIVGGCEPDAHDLSHRLGVQVPSPPGCAPVRYLHQHHGGEIFDLLQPEIIHAESGFGCNLVEQVLRPSGCVLPEYELGSRTPVGSEFG